MAEDTNCNGRVIVQREIANYAPLSLALALSLSPQGMWFWGGLGLNGGIWMGSKGGVPRIRQRWGLRVWGTEWQDCKGMVEVVLV